MVELRHLEAVPRKGQYEMRKMKGGKYETNTLIPYNCCYISQLSGTK
jgi:hypothetical protein